MVDKDNPVRLKRALEVSISSGIPYSSFLGKSNKKRHFVSKMILLQCPREKLYNKINKRVDLMLHNGLKEEAYNLVMKYRNLTPLKTIGYKELFNHFEGTLSFDDAINEIKKNTEDLQKNK